tara:strand:+ start:609 stop:1010 length:402 start_codon:yes stop_codon:yes gene_type:complete
MKENLKILIADEYETVSRITAIMLRNFYENSAIDFAKTGIDVIEMVEKNKYDLVLMDSCLPEMSGVEATRLLKAKKENRNLKILGMSIYQTNIYIDEFRGAGASGFIIKDKLNDYMKKATENLVSGSDFFIYI